MSVVQHPEHDRCIIRDRMRKLCAGIDAEQTEHFMAGALAMLEMGEDPDRIMRVAAYTVRRAEIRCADGAGTPTFSAKNQ